MAMGEKAGVISRFIFESDSQRISVLFEAKNKKTQKRVSIVNLKLFKSQDFVLLPCKSPIGN